MLKLYGFCISNYYNKIKLALLEKGVPFEEVEVLPSQEPEVLRYSPLGKVPYILTEQGPLSESQPIAEYLEDTFPAVPLMPADAFERAKCRELVQYLELHLELVARRLYPEAFFGKPVAEAVKTEARELLERNLARTAELISFDPYIAGGAFGIADCAAWVHFPLIARATKAVYGVDMLAAALGGEQVRRYLELIGSRPHAQSVGNDRKQAVQAMAAK